MRPLQLVLTAFGPYRNKEIINFEELQDHRLFVISGNTGAGKTTIFDALCFALYGSASGEDRTETRNLRSQFADDDVHTSVELVFSVKEKQYRILRQMKHRKGNNKSETGEKIELFEITSSGEVPAVDRFVIRDVDMKLATIIGLSKDQFSQIVMLPQGEFRKLLTSSTDNKEEILRKIFRTELFDQLEQVTGVQYKSMQEQVKEQLGAQTSMIRHIAEQIPLREGSLLATTYEQEQQNIYQVTAGLEEEAAYYKQEQVRLEQLKIEQAELLSSARKSLQEAEQTNMKLAEYAQKQTELTNLTEQASTYEQFHIKIQLAERAMYVLPYETRYQRAQQVMIEQEQQQNNQQETILHIQKQYAAVEQHYSRLEQQDDKRKQLELAIHQLQQLLPTVQQYRTALKENKAAQLQQERAHANVMEKEQSLQLTKQQKLQLQEQLKHTEDVQQNSVLLQGELTEIERQGKLVTRMLDYVKELKELELQRQQLLDQAEQGKVQLASAEQRWIEGQAYELARHLQDGQPCPVCGSEHHPQAAVAMIDMPSKTELDTYKAAYSQYEQQLTSWQAHRSAKCELLEQQLEQLDAHAQTIVKPFWSFTNVEEVSRLLEAVLDVQSELRLSWKAKKEQFDQLKMILEQAQTWKQQLQQLEQQYELQEQQLAQLQQVEKQTSLLKATLDSRIDQLETMIPVHLRDDATLSEQLKEQQAAHKEMEQQWKQAKEDKANIERKLTAETAQLEQLTRTMGGQQQEVKTSLEEYHEQLTAAAFGSEVDYMTAKLDKLELEQLKNTYREYQEQLAKLTHQLELLEAAVVNKQYIELEPLQVRLSELQHQFEQLITQDGVWVQHAKDIASFIERLQSNYTELQHVEEQLAILADLYTTMKGDNPLKLSFERYILIDYLEQILVMANIRLSAISNGQFELQRSDRLETHGKQSGLGLDVYDAYTGQNRDVKTLSGGEKFNAALCLALGMTDVIQAHQGGVSIEMMFIDEGFGSLDEESLQKAIATLVDLQRAGRMIGVISHVQELKDALPACLEVTKNRDGHSSTKFVVK